MKRVAILVFASMLAAGAAGHAQQKCKSFAGLAQATLPSSTPLSGSDVWGGRMEAFLDSELLLGAFSGNDGDDTWLGLNGLMGQGRSGSYTVCVGYPACADTLTYDVSMAVFPTPPGQKGLGSYSGNSARITGGTGRFATATGNLNVTGPYIAWTDNGSPFGVSGRWNAQLSGQICGIQ